MAWIQNFLCGLKFLHFDDAAFLELDHSKCPGRTVRRRGVFAISDVAAHPVRRILGLAIDSSRQDLMCTECLVNGMKKVECRSTDHVAFVRVVNTLLAAADELVVERLAEWLNESCASIGPVYWRRYGELGRVGGDG